MSLAMDYPMMLAVLFIGQVPDSAGGKQATVPLSMHHERYEVPLEVWGNVGRQTLTLVGDGSIGCELEASPTEGRLTFYWFVEGRRNHSQEMALGYTPTAFAKLPAPYEFLVAGTTAEGHTKVERIQLETPVVICARGSAGNVLLRETVFFAPNGGGLQDVYHIAPNRADASRLFVEIHAPRLIYDVNLETREAHLVASSVPVSGADVLSSPLLENEQDLFYSRDHQEHGYVYFLRHPEAEAIPVLRDVDKDGRLDDVLDVPLSSWGELFGDPHLYND